MAKEFKKFDNAFSRAEIKACRDKWLFGDVMSRWHFGYDQPSVDDARYAVYEADGFMDWQLFRVALKGLSTVEKISMLTNRWNVCVEDLSIEQERIRIMNYIGALRRGGQLDADLRIVK